MKRDDKSQERPRDPASHLKAEGGMRTRVVRDRKKLQKSDRAAEKARIKKEIKDD